MAGPRLPDELAGMGDIDDIRCTIFQWRASQRRVQHSWLERTFGEWGQVRSTRKTRRCLTNRCSVLRNRRTTATTLGEWRAEASKVRRRRRLGVIYVMRNMENIAGRVLRTWCKLVQLNRKFVRLTSHFHDNTSHKAFRLWLNYHRTFKVFSARIRNSMNKIHFRSTVRGINGWREVVRSKKRLTRQSSILATMFGTGFFRQFFHTWHAAVLQSRELANNNGEASRAVAYLMQRVRLPFFVAWRKQARRSKGLDTSFCASASLGASSSQNAPFISRPVPEDPLTARVTRWKHAAAWQLMGTALLHANVPPSRNAEDTRAAFLHWAAFAAHRRRTRERTRLLLYRHSCDSVSAIFCAWKMFVAVNRNLTTQSALVSELWTRFILRDMWRCWYRAMIGERSWRRVLMVLETRLRTQEIRLKLCTIYNWEAAAIAFQTALRRSMERVRVGQYLVMRRGFTTWAALVESERQLREKGEALSLHGRQHVLKSCWIFWVNCLSSREADAVVGRLFDFPYDCRVLLMMRDFPYGSLRTCALIGLHRERASAVWQTVTRAEHRRTRLLVLKWRAVALERREWALFLQRGRGRLLATKLKRVMLCWSNAASWQAVKAQAIWSCLCRQTHHARRKSALETWKAFAMRSLKVAASSSNVMRRHLQLALDKWRENVEVSITLARRRSLADKMRRKRGREWLRRWQSYIDTKWHVDHLVQKCTRALAERCVSAWSWMSSYRHWRQRAVVFCLERRQVLVLRRMVVVWEEEIRDRVVLRYVGRKIRRVRFAYTFRWWLQYTQERRLSVRIQSHVNMTRLLESYQHLEVLTGVRRLRSLGFYWVCGRRINTLLDSCVSSWLSWVVVIKRVRNRNLNIGRCIALRYSRDLAAAGLRALYRAANTSLGICHAGDKSESLETACLSRHTPLAIVARSRLCGSMVRRVELVLEILARMNLDTMHATFSSWRLAGVLRRLVVRHTAKRGAQAKRRAMHGFAALPALETRAAWLRERSALVFKNQIGRLLSMQLTVWKSISGGRKQLQRLGYTLYARWSRSCLSIHTCEWALAANQVRRLARTSRILRLKHAMSVKRLAFIGLLVARRHTARDAGVLQKATRASNCYVQRAVALATSEWRYQMVVDWKRQIGRAYAKAKWHLCSMRSRACFLLWIVFANRQKRYVRACEAVSSKCARTRLCAFVAMWRTTILEHHHLIRTRAAVFREWVRSTAGLSCREIMVQHGLQHVHQRVVNDLAFLAFELWGGRSKTKQRLYKVGLRLDRNYTHGMCRSTFESWLAAVHGFQSRRRRRAALALSCRQSLLSCMMNGWALRVADVCRRCEREVNTAHRREGALAVLHRRVQYKIFRAWQSRVESSRLQCGTAEVVLLKFVHADTKHIAAAWFFTQNMLLRGRAISRRYSQSRAWVRLRTFSELCLWQRHRASDLTLHMRALLVKRSMGIWVRKARLLSLVADMASLQARVLVSSHLDSAHVTITNLSPAKFLRAYYLRERQSLQTWRHVACRKQALRRMAMLVSSRRRRSLFLVCLEAFGLTENFSNSPLSEPQTQFSHRQGSAVGLDTEDGCDEGWCDECATRSSEEEESDLAIASPALSVAESRLRRASAEPVTQLSSRSGGGKGAAAREAAGREEGETRDDRSPAASPLSGGVPAHSAYFSAHPYYMPLGR